MRLTKALLGSRAPNLPSRFPNPRLLVTPRPSDRFDDFDGFMSGTGYDWMPMKRFCRSEGPSTLRIESEECWSEDRFGLQSSSVR